MNVNKESNVKEFNELAAGGKRLDRLEGTIEFKGENDVAEMFEEDMFVEEKLSDTKIFGWRQEL